MKPARFELHRATSIEHALDLLTRLNRRGDAKPIAGGQSLVPMMNFRLARPDYLVDLSAVEEMKVVEPLGDRLRVGAMVTQRDCLADATVVAWCPLLVRALTQVGHGHIRNRGTVGGSVAHADPAAELPTALVALEGEVEIHGPNGRRLVAADDFFDGWFTTRLGDDELLTALHLTRTSTSAEWGFEELSRRQGDYAMVLTATLVDHDERGAITSARIVLGGVGPTPIRAREAERVLEGSSGAARFDDAATMARAECHPGDDVHADATYRSEMIEVLVQRSLAAGRSRARRTTGDAGSHPPVAPTPGGTPTSRPTRPPEHRTERRSEAKLEVNGEPRSLSEVPDRRLLADYLRDDLGLTGTHLGCEHGVCGACTVLIDDNPARSCLVFARQLAGQSVTTIEHLGRPHELHPVQEAFRANHGLQCGFCTPGMVLAAVDLLRRHPDPSERVIREELSGNLCRCTGYVKIVESVRAAAGSTDSDSPRPSPSEPENQPGELPESPRPLNI